MNKLSFVFDISTLFLILFSHTSRVADALVADWNEFVDKNENNDDDDDDLGNLFEEEENGTPKASDPQDPEYSPSGKSMTDHDDEGTDSDEQDSDEDDETPGTPPSGKKKRRLSVGKNSGASQAKKHKQTPKGSKPRSRSVTPTTGSQGRPGKNVSKTGRRAAPKKSAARSYAKAKKKSKITFTHKHCLTSCFLLVGVMVGSYVCECL